MPRKLDEIDLKIIKSLMSDARRSATQLSKDVGVSRLTIINRLKKLTAENIIGTNMGINIGKLGFQTALVALEVKGDLKQQMERNLSDCPRVLTLLRLNEKANLLVLLYGENQNTLGSTIERLRDLPSVNIVYVHHSRPPLFPKAFSLRVFPEKNDLTPCGRKCRECLCYQNDRCVGCPAVTEYKGPL